MSPENGSPAVQLTPPAAHGVPEGLSSSDEKGCRGGGGGRLLPGGRRFPFIECSSIARVLEISPAGFFGSLLFLVPLAACLDLL